MKEALPPLLVDAAPTNCAPVVAPPAAAIPVIVTYSVVPDATGQVPAAGVRMYV